MAGRPPSPDDIAELWHEIIVDPDDDGPRAVLGDLLHAAGDRALQRRVPVGLPDAVARPGVEIIVQAPRRAGNVRWE